MRYLMTLNSCEHLSPTMFNASTNSYRPAQVRRLRRRHFPRFKHDEFLHTALTGFYGRFHSSPSLQDMIKLSNNFKLASIDSSTTCNAFCRCDTKYATSLIERFTSTSDINSRFQISGKQEQTPVSSKIVSWRSQQEIHS